MNLDSTVLTYPKLLLFGDSIVQYSTRPGGMAALLEEEYERKLEVVVRGFSGYNSNQYLTIARSVLNGLGSGPIAGIVLLIGTNDATFKESYQHVDIDRTIDNLRNLLGILLEFTDKVYVVPPGYCVDSLRDDRCDADFARYSSKILKEAPVLNRQKISTIATRDALKNVDNKKFNEEVPIYDPDCFVEDGLHLSSLGYKKLSDAIITTLKAGENGLSERYLRPKLPSHRAFMHITVEDQEALLRGHLAIESAQLTTGMK